MVKTDWLKYRNGSSYTSDGLYNSGYGWNTWDLIQELYDNGDLTYKASETIEKLTNFKNQYIIRM